MGTTFNAAPATALAVGVWRIDILVDLSAVPNTLGISLSAQVTSSTWAAERVNLTNTYRLTGLLKVTGSAGSVTPFVTTGLAAVTIGLGYMTLRKVA